MDRPGVSEANRERQGALNPNARVTASNVLFIRLERSYGATIAELARQYKIAEPTVFDIIHGRSYRNCGGPVEPVRKLGRRDR